MREFLIIWVLLFIGHWLGWFHRVWFTRRRLKKWLKAEMKKDFDEHMKKNFWDPILYGDGLDPETGNE